MGAIYQENPNKASKRNNAKMRPSYLTQAKHINDSFSNLGYNYNGNILKNGTSPVLWSNPQQNLMFGQIEGMIVYLIESTKMIKKWFAIAHDKSSTRLT